MSIKVNQDEQVVHDAENIQPQCNADHTNENMQLLQDQDLVFYIRNEYDLCDHCWPIKTGPARKR